MHWRFLVVKVLPMHYCSLHSVSSVILGQQLTLLTEVNNSAIFVNYDDHLLHPYLEDKLNYAIMLHFFIFLFDGLLHLCHVCYRLFELAACYSQHQNALLGGVSVHEVSRCPVPSASANHLKPLV